MKELTFIEKLGILWQNILAHPIFIGILLLPIIFIIINKKITKKHIIVIYLLILATVFFVSNTTIFELFDNMVDGIFMSLYFPNFITLFIVEVSSAIIAFITFIKHNINKINKIINITGFIIIQTLFCLIITIIKSNNIDIYKENALYASNDILTLMQLLMGTFALQIIGILVVFSIEKITEFLDGNTKKQKPIKFTKAKIITPFIEKEPEIKLEKQKPLNKDYIKIKEIEPLDIKEEIKLQEEQKKKNEEKQIQEKQNLILKQKHEEKLQLAIERNKLDSTIKPLDKTLIDIKPITPVDINKQIPKEYPQNTKNISPINQQEKNIELITNLNIVNFNKTKKVIKNLKRVYTL